VRVFKHLIIGFPLSLYFRGFFVALNWHNYWFDNKHCLVDNWQSPARTGRFFERDCLKSVFRDDWGVNGGAASKFLDELTSLGWIKSALWLRLRLESNPVRILSILNLSGFFIPPRFYLVCSRTKLVTCSYSRQYCVKAIWGYAHISFVWREETVFMIAL